VGPFVAVLMGVGLSLGGLLMLVRPEVFRDVPPDPTQSLRSIRIGGIGLLLIGILLLGALLATGARPCLLNECTDF
jgi:hypothetical protein